MFSYFARSGFWNLGFSDGFIPKTGFHNYLHLELPGAEIRKDLNANCLFGR